MKTSSVGGEGLSASVYWGGGQLGLEYELKAAPDPKVGGSGFKATQGWASRGREEREHSPLGVT